MSRIAILGVGAIGSIYGARLCELKKHEVVLCVRKSFAKFKIEMSSRVLETSVDCVTLPKEVNPVDWIILAVKCHQVESVQAWFKHLVGPKTVVAVFQNGVEHFENTKPYVYGAEILPVVVQCPADRLSPGHVVQNAMSRLVVPDNASGRELSVLYEGSDIDVELTSDFTTAMWKKLCGNIARNPATALTNRGRGVVKDSEVSKVCQTLVDECAEVGRAEGAILSDDFLENVVSSQSGIEEDGTTSMLVDVRAGLPLESEGMTGAIIRAGVKHGIPTPITCAIHSLLSAINRE